MWPSLGVGHLTFMCLRSCDQFAYNLPNLLKQDIFTRPFFSGLVSIDYFHGMTGWMALPRCITLGLQTILPETLLSESSDFYVFGPGFSISNGKPLVSFTHQLGNRIRYGNLALWSRECYFHLANVVAWFWRFGCVCYLHTLPLSFINVNCWIHFTERLAIGSRSFLSLLFFVFSWLI